MSEFGRFMQRVNKIGCYSHWTTNSIIVSVNVTSLEELPQNPTFTNITYLLMADQPRDTPRFAGRLNTFRIVVLLVRNATKPPEHRYGSFFDEKTSHEFSFGIRAEAISIAETALLEVKSVVDKLEVFAIDWEEKLDGKLLLASFE